MEVMTRTKRAKGKRMMKRMPRRTMKTVRHNKLMRRMMVHM